MQLLVKRTLKKMPPFSEQMIHGQSRIENNYISSVDELFDGVTGNSNVGVKYNGFKRLTPKEEVESITSKGDGSKKTGVKYDITQSDVRKVLFIFEYDKRPIYIPLYMPVIREGGIFTISGTKSYIAPVLSDPIISMMNNYLFIRPLNDKIKVYEEIYCLNLNGGTKLVTIYHAPSLFKQANISNGDFGEVVVPFALELLGRMSISSILIKYTDLVYGEDFKFIKREEGMVDKYPDFDIYEPTGTQLPKMRKVVAERSDNCILIRKSKNNIFVENIAASILYSFDAIPRWADNIVKSIGTAEEVQHWRMLLGTIIHKDSYSPTRIVPATDEHIRVVDNYIYGIVKGMFKEIGVEIDSFADLIHHVISEYANYKERMSKLGTVDLRNKKLEVQYYISYVIIAGINTAINDIEKSYRKGNISYTSVKSALERNLSSRIIFNVTKSRKPSLAIYAATSTHDNWVFKIHAINEIQERGDGVYRSTGKKAVKFPKTIQKLDAYDLLIGNMFYLPKNAASPRLRLNPTGIWGKDKKIIVPPELEGLLEELNKKLHNNTTSHVSAQLAEYINSSAVETMDLDD